MSWLIVFWFFVALIVFSRMLPQPRDKNAHGVIYKWGDKRDGMREYEKRLAIIRERVNRVPYETWDAAEDSWWKRAASAIHDYHIRSAKGVSIQHRRPREVRKLLRSVK